MTMPIDKDMVLNHIVFIILISIICLLCLASFVNEVLFLWFNSLAFLLMMVVIFKGNSVYAILALSGFVISAVINTVIFSFHYLYIIFVSCILLAATLFYYYHMVCTKEIGNSLNKKLRATEEKNELERRCEVKDESLKGLYEKGDELFKLFEVAKEFNECISFNEIGKILAGKIFYDLPFKSGILIILEGKKKKSIFKMYKCSEQYWEEFSGESGYDIQKLIVLLEGNKKMLEISHANVEFFDFIDEKAVTFPIWIFPLLVEDQIISIFILEGGHKDDFSKFLIIASQLALQIKKINLYNTVKELSITDGLTGVFVRRHFLERFNEEIKRSLKNHFNLSVLMLDIDHFKMYNDTFGHLVGDVTLREVAKIIKDNVRKVDLISRYGGEEFAIVLPETNKEGGIEAAERIRLAVSKKKFRVYDEETKVTVSIGLASLPEDVTIQHDEFQPELALELLQKADQSLYNAKEQGRDRVISYNSDIN